jgi:putative transposase
MKNILPSQKIDWPHAPIHRFDSRGVYMVTAATLHKQHLFVADDSLDFLQRELMSLAERYEWDLHAWAVFSNHYHFVARSQQEVPSLGKFLSHLHSNTARELNRVDQKQGRDVWFNFWDSKLTYERSYMARLNYVHQNPVKHGLVSVANQYRWCSAGWFERTASPAMIKTIYAFKIDKLNIADDY